MNRQSGLVALIALLLALVATMKGKGGEEVQEEAKSKAAIAEESTDRPGELGARLLRMYFGLATDSTALDETRLWAGHTLAVLLATVPDPAASHLDWTFDSQVDSIRRAHERAGFVLFAQEHPWKLGPGGGGAMARAPGALLFRRSGEVSTDLRIVYLVGEVTTLGIDRGALSLALTGRESLRVVAGAAFSEPAVLRIVGPTFSGSSRSLKAGLLGHAYPDGTKVERVEIVSGAATSEANKTRLEHVDQKLTIHYSSTLHTDETLLAVFRHFVLGALGLGESEVAILQENSTEYGKVAVGKEKEGNAQDGFLRLPFPMSVQSLRTVYAREGKDEDDAKLPGRSKESKVDLDLHDLPRPLETPGLTSPLSTQSIELLFDEITRTLGQRKIKAVLIFTTDVRDKLFLGKELKRRLPDLQLVTTESNILYLEPKLNRFLRGMIVLSTYPLLLRDPSWLWQSNRNEQLMFASEGSEGTFNATLVHLMEALGSDESLLADYGFPLRLEPEPGHARRIPAVWGTTVGAGAMLPLFVRAEKELQGDRCRQLGAEHERFVEGVPLADQRKSPAKSEGSTQPSVFLSLFLLLSLGLLATVGQSATDYRKRWDGELVLLHEGYTIAAFLVWLAALLPMLVAFLCMEWVLLPSSSVIVLLLAALALFGFRRWEAWDQHRGSLRELCRYPWEVAALAFFFVVALACLGGCAWFAGAFASLEGAAFQLFLHRAAEVEQGVTPLVPLLLVGLLVGFWFHGLRSRVRFLADRVAFEGFLDGLPREHDRLGEASGPMYRRLRELFSPVPPLLFLVLLALLGWDRFSTPLEALTDVGVARPFAWSYRLGILGGMLGTGWACGRVLLVWMEFRRLLHRLADLAITLPFKDLREVLRVTANLSMWPSSHGTELESLARVKWPELRALLPQEPLIDDEVLFRRRKNRPAVALALAALMSRIRAAPLEFDKEKRVLPAWLVLARQVVALELLIYVEWVLRHLRQLSVFLVLGSLLVLAVVGSYPFQPQSEFQWLAFGLFGLALATVVFLILSLNRNATLSRLAGTTPGALSLDRTLLLNVGLFVIAPLTAVIGTQGGWIRSILDKILPLLISS